MVNSYRRNRLLTLPKGGGFDFKLFHKSASNYSFEINLVKSKIGLIGENNLKLSRYRVTWNDAPSFGKADSLFLLCDSTKKKFLLSSQAMSHSSVMGIMSTVAVPTLINLHYIKVQMFLADSHYLNLFWKFLIDNLCTYYILKFWCTSSCYILIILPVHNVLKRIERPFYAADFDLSFESPVTFITFDCEKQKHIRPW